MATLKKGVASLLLSEYIKPYSLFSFLRHQKLEALSRHRVLKMLLREGRIDETLIGEGWCLALLQRNLKRGLYLLI